MQVASPEVKQCLTNVFKQQLENTPEAQQRDTDKVPRRIMAKSPLHPTTKPEVLAEPVTEDTMLAQQEDSQSVASAFVQRLQSFNVAHMVLALAAVTVVRPTLPVRSMLCAACGDETKRNLSIP